MSQQIYRKGRCERTARTILRTAEFPYMGAHYRTRPPSSGGSGGVLNGHGAPTDDPGVDAAIYYDLDDGSIYKWDPDALDWNG